jgi:hypothetical protein
MANNVLIIVGADKGGVGKTTVSRTLIDYFASWNVPTRAFDTEYPKGTLKRFHPDVTEVVDITAVSDQMRIFDRLGKTDKSTIIDVRAGSLLSTLQLLRNVGFLQAIKRAEIKLVIFHILGPSLASLKEITDIASFVTDAEYYLVRNFVNDAQFSEWDQSTYNSHIDRIGHANEIIIPKLNEMAYEQVELASVPFVSFITNKGAKRKTVSYSYVLRGYVRHWLGSVWLEYDRIKLYDIIGPMASNAVERNMLVAV